MFTGGFSLWHMLILAFVGLLIFGRRLPEVGRSLGKGITEFKKGLKDVGDEVTSPNEQAGSHQAGYDRQMPAANYQQQPLPPAHRPQPTARIEQPSARQAQTSPGVRVGRQDMVD